MDGASSFIRKAGGIILDSVYNPRSRFYLVHRPHYNDWSFPKGTWEAGETISDTALREVKEETGLACSIVKPLPMYHYWLSDGQRVHVYFFEMLVTSEGVKSDGEVDEGAWKSLEEVTMLLSYPSLNEYFCSIY